MSRSARVANPGCHATGFISIVYPLVAMGILPKDEALSCFSLTGYSGGGKKMIAQYESPDRPRALSSPALYGLMQNHKHLPEMQKVCGLETPPVFVPIVDDYYKGMAGTVPFHMNRLKGVHSLREVWERLHDYYVRTSGEGGVVRVEIDPTDPESGVDSDGERRAVYRNGAVRQSGQGSFRRGGAEYEYYAGLPGDHRAFHLRSVFRAG